MSGSEDVSVDGDRSAVHRLRILTNYRKSNHPEWLKAVELYESLPGEISRSWGRKLPITYRLRRQAAWAWRLFRLSKKYDVVLTGSDGGALLFALAQRTLRRRRVPHIYLDFLVNLEGSKFKQSLVSIAFHLAVGGSSYAMVQRACEVEAYSRALHLPSSKFRFVPYHATTFDHQPDIHNDEYIFAGGDAARDYPLLVEAAKDLPYRVIIAALLRHHFRGLSIPKNVEVVSVSGQEFLKLMAGARLIVVPLKWRPQHIGGEQTYLNAMTMGKPVVITDVNAGDYVENGVTGILTPAGNVQALRESIKKVMEDPEFAQSLGRKAKEASLSFTPEKFFAAVFELCTRSVSAPQESR